jgi:hypothetical protein
MPREEPENRSGPMERLKGEVGELAGALGKRAITGLLDKVEGTTGRLNKYVEGGGGPGIMAAVTGAKDLAEGKSPARSMLGAGMTGIKEKISGLFRRGGKGGGGKKLKLTNIVESIDVGVPVTLAYNQWTQYKDQRHDRRRHREAEGLRQWRARATERPPRPPGGGLTCRRRRKKSPGPMQDSRRACTYTGSFPET